MKLLPKLLIFFSFLLALQGNCKVSFAMQSTKNINFYTKINSKEVKVTQNKKAKFLGKIKKIWVKALFVFILGLACIGVAALIYNTFYTIFLARLLSSILVLFGGCCILAVLASFVACRRNEPTYAIPNK
jgi:hypothetical protein